MAEDQVNGASAARSARLLALLSAGKAQVTTLQDRQSMLLVFEGEKSIRCPKPVLAEWLSSGAATLSGTCLTISDAGRARLRRGANAAGLEMTDNFAAQHRKVEATRIGGERIFRNQNESPLSRLRQLKDGSGRDWISLAEFEAGERLRRDFDLAHLAPRVTQSLDPHRTPSKQRRSVNTADSMMASASDARERVNDALDAIGPELAGLAVDICCFLKGLETVESERNWPRRSAKVVLKTALAALARHYFPVARGRKGRGVVAWGAEGYRPTLRAGEK